MTNDHIDIDEPVIDATDAEMHSIVNAKSLQGVPAFATKFSLSENDIKAGKELCKSTIKNIIDLKLPDTIKQRPELLKVIELQQSFEEFTLQSMFAVVAQAVQLLKQLTVTDDIYDIEGSLSVVKLQAVLATQQHVMNLIQQFNLHVRRLPQAITDMLHEVEYSQTFQVQVQEVDDKENIDRHITSKPLAVLMNEANAELAEYAEETKDADKRPEHAEFVPPVPETVNDDDINIEL